MFHVKQARMLSHAVACGLHYRDPPRSWLVTLKRAAKSRERQRWQREARTEAGCST